MTVGSGSNQLAKDSVTLRHVMAEGLMANAPIASFVVVMTATAAYGLGATPLAYLIGGLVVFAWINTPYQFSKRLASSGGVQYYVHKTNPLGGYMAGLSYLVYYIAILGGNILVYGLVIPLVLQQVGIALPALSWIVISLLLFLPVLLITYFGIKLSLTYGVITVLIEIAIVVVTSLFIIFNHAVVNTLAVYNPKIALGGISGFGVALLVASFGISGTTATVYLGAEAKLPHQTIKKALLYSTLLVFAIYILASYAYTVGWGVSSMGTFATAIGPGLIEIGKYIGIIPEIVVLIFAINSLIGLTVASLVIDSRLILSLSKQGLFPQSLAKTHPKYMTPYRATIFAVILGGTLMFVVAGILGPLEGFIWLILVASMGEFIGHIIGDVALPFYYRRVREFKITKHLVVPIVSLGIIMFGMFFTFYPVIFPLIYAPILVLAILVSGVIHYKVKTSKPGMKSQLEEKGNELGVEL